MEYKNDSLLEFMYLVCTFIFSILKSTSNRRGSILIGGQLSFSINLLVQAIETYIFSLSTQDLKHTIEVVPVQLVPFSHLIFLSPSNETSLPYDLNG